MIMPSEHETSRVLVPPETQEMLNLFILLTIHMREEHQRSDSWPLLGAHQDFLEGFRVRPGYECEVGPGRLRKSLTTRQCRYCQERLIFWPEHQVFQLAEVGGSAQITARKFELGLQEAGLELFRRDVEFVITDGREVDATKIE